MPGPTPLRRGRLADVLSARTVKCDRMMLARRLDVCSSVDLGRLEQDAMVSIEELEAAAAAAGAG